MRADEASPRPGRIAWCTPVALTTLSLAIGLLSSPMVLAQDAAATPPAAQEPVPDLDTLLALAKQGHPVAQFNLGVKYDFGQGVEKDPAQAIRWYRLAAAQGHGGAQFNLGGMYFEGLGVKRDLLRATMWFTLSAEAGVGGAAKNRAILARALSPEQQAQARTMALECRQRAFKDCEP
ncbi:MAG: sel1 repeat family protein [Rhodoferax sp.]|nr:sel1 repeat family protein [Rhodoferax sp.]